MHLCQKPWPHSLVLVQKGDVPGSAQNAQDGSLRL
jgi:hypothetical protein